VNLFSHPIAPQSNATIARRLIGEIMPKAILALAASVGLTAAPPCVAIAQGPANQNQTPQIIAVSAKKYEFTPSEIRVKQGTKVELKVHSEDETHGMKLSVYPEGAKDKKKPGLLFDHPDDNGKVTKDVDQILDFVAQDPGTYEFKCAKVCGMGHGRMKGTLVVEP
jgi:heme/copper-type cytochrome/quinol oxidase subunit 2